MISLGDVSPHPSDLGSSRPPGPIDVLRVARMVRCREQVTRPDGARMQAYTLPRVPEGGTFRIALTVPESRSDASALTLSRADYIREVIKKETFMLHVKSFADGVAISNDFAPEHLSLICADEKKWLSEIRTAGAIYVGNLSAVAVGDFLAGPSHTLPTGGSGRSFSGLRADQFQRRTSVVKLDAGAVKKSLASVEEFARIEGLDAHGRSVSIRVDG